MTARLILLLVVALVIGVLGGGCGGGDDESASDANGGSTQPTEGSQSSSDSGSAEGTDAESNNSANATAQLSKAQFLAKANAICHERAERVVTFEPTGKVNEPEGETFEEAAISEALGREFESVVNEIRTLGAPSGDEAQIEAFLVALQRDVTATEEKKPATFEAAEKLFQSSAALANKYGLTKCAFA